MRVEAGKFKSRLLKTPKGATTRPTSGKVRSSLFDILQNKTEGARFLDLFAGSGAIGIEALSRGAKEVYFVEQNRNAALCIRENCRQLSLPCPLFQGPAQKACIQLKKEKRIFDIIFADPPYAQDIAPLLDTLVDLIDQEGILILEQRRNTKIFLENWDLIDERNFGDTTLYFFSPSPTP